MEKRAYTYMAQIFRVVDGDTVDLIIDLGFHVGIKERVRLNGIDAYEMNDQDPDKRRKAQDGKTFLEWFMGKDLMIESFKKDKYGRYLVDIYGPSPLGAGGDCKVNDALISVGLAVDYHGGPRT